MRRRLFVLCVFLIPGLLAGCGGEDPATERPEPSPAAQKAAQERRAQDAQAPVRALMLGLLSRDHAAVCGAFQLARVRGEDPAARLPELCAVDPEEIFDPDDGLPLGGLELALPIGFTPQGERVRSANPDTDNVGLRQVELSVAGAMVTDVPLRTLQGRDDHGLYTVVAGEAPTAGIRVGFFDGVPRIASLGTTGVEDDDQGIETASDRFRACLQDRGGRQLFDRGLPDQPQDGTAAFPLFDETAGARPGTAFEYDEGITPHDVTLELVPLESAGAARRAYRTVQITDPGRRAALLRAGSVMFVSVAEPGSRATIPDRVIELLALCARQDGLTVNGPRMLHGPSPG